MIERCSDIFYGFKTYYPFKYYKNIYSFSIYNYLIGFFFNSIKSPQVLLSFITEYNNILSSGDYSSNDICSNEMYILFNFMKIYFPKINFRKYKNNLIFEKLEIRSDNIELNFNELSEIFNCIQNYKPSLIVSMLFLRRFLPYILYIISKRTGIEPNIYYFANETIFDNGVKILKLDLDKEQEINLVREYVEILKKLLWQFSLNGKKFSTFFKDINIKRNQNFVKNRNYIFYNFGIQRINRIKANYEESFDILNYAYEKLSYKIQIDYNWNFHFFELLFQCFYLNFIDCSIKLNIFNKEGKKSNPFTYYLNNFLDYYEYYDYYLNFINQEGAFMNISRLINSN